MTFLRKDLFQTVKSIPFPEVQAAFHGAEPRCNKISCPWHQDKTPSMHIYPDGFKCYSCGAYGDGTAFVAKLFGIRHLEAAKLIAEKFGLTVQEGSVSRQERLKLARANAKRLREKKLLEAFKVFVREAIWTVRLLAEAITLVLQEEGVDIDNELLPLVHELPKLEYWADVLAEGTMEDKISVFWDQGFRRWFNCKI